MILGKNYKVLVECFWSSICVWPL